MSGCRGRGRGRRGRTGPRSTISKDTNDTTTTVMDELEQNESYENERSASAFSSLTNSIRNLRVDSTSTIQASRSQTVCPVNPYQKLQSVVPDLVVLTPVHRPDSGGSLGEKIEIFTNHFPITIDDAVVYQYDINIFMIDRNGKSHVARKDDRWEALQTFIKKQEDFPVVWYDEGNTLYSREMLPDVITPFLIELKTDDGLKKFHIAKLNLVRQNKIKDLHDFIGNKTNTRPQEIVRIVETLFKQRARNDTICIRNQYYDRRRNLDNLGDGRGLSKGFYQSLFLTQIGPTINVNLSFTSFYLPLNFIEFASQYLRKDITQNFQESDVKAFGKIIRNLSIETMHTGRKIFYRLHEFGRPANQIMFSPPVEGAADAVPLKEVSVADYFATKHKRKLRYPYLPCINAMKGNQNKPNWLPMEVVTVVPWQRAIKPLDKSQRSTMSSNTILPPQDRFREIMTIVRNNLYNREPYLKELNIHVQDNAMLKIEARILNPPVIKYRNNRGRGEVIEYVKFGKWRMRNWFYETTRITSWGIIYFGDRPNRQCHDILAEFQNQLPNLLQKNGFGIDSKPTLTIKSPADDDIYHALHDASQQRWTLAIIILDSRNANSDRTYSLVKTYGSKDFGLMTQCVDYQALKRNIDKLDMYVENLSQKINGKLGGINGVVNLKSALNRSSRDDLFMFFGADVTHSTCSSDCPSIAAVVGSRDLTNNLYAARICEQYPRKGRCSLEIIKDLEKMVIDLLKVFAQSCGNRLPNKIIFYRDGVDEGQYQKVLDHEVSKIKNACRNVYENRPLPQVTFIVVKKRHNTRFFLQNGQQIENLPAGTVIDKGITHPTQFDFYLCSQAPGKGTSRPALYHVLHDDIGFTSDDIQQLTYWLCHTDMRCRKSVSIPAPVHYAHLAAYAARILKFGEDHDKESVDEDNQEVQNFSLDDIKTKVMMLDKKLADGMWFL